MDPEIAKFIKENPERANALADQWQAFINTYARENPEILSVNSKEEFLRWTKQHPEKNINPNIWTGKEIIAVYLTRRQEDSRTQAQGDGDKKEERQGEGAKETPSQPTSPSTTQQPQIQTPTRGFFNRGIGRGSARLGGRAAGRTGSMAGRLASRFAAQAGMMVGRAAAQAGVALVANPVGLIVIGVIVAIIIIVFLIIMFAGGGGGGCSSSLNKKVFVTSTKSNGNLVAYVKNNIDSAFSGDGLQAGDRICQWRADNAAPSPLGGTWTAWLSTNIIDAKDRIADQKYVRAECDEVIVADNKADLINGDIDNPIAKDENSNFLKDVGVWTGTADNGQRITNDNCSNWTAGDSSQGGMTGNSGSKTDESWTSFFSIECDRTNYHLYCFEQ